MFSQNRMCELTVVTKMSTSQELCLTFLLVGKTGSGKSCTGNFILGDKVFKDSDLFQSETNQIQVRSATVDGYTLTVVDTPGVMHTGLDLEAIKLKTCNEMKEAVSKCPDEGKMAVVIVLKYGDRFTEENKTTVDILKQMFGEENLCRSCVIVMTYGDEYVKKYKGNKQFKVWMEEQKGALSELLDKLVHYRCVLFNNKCKDSQDVQRQRQRIIDLVNDLDQGYTKAQFSLLKRQHHRLVFETKVGRMKRDYYQKINKLYECFHSICTLSKCLDTYDNLNSALRNYLEELNKADDPRTIFYREGEPLFFDELRGKLYTLETMVEKQQKLDEYVIDLKSLTEKLEKCILLNTFDELDNLEKKFNYLSENITQITVTFNNKLEMAQTKLLEAKQIRTHNMLGSQLEGLQTEFKAIGIPALVSTFSELLDKIKKLGDTIEAENNALGGMVDLLEAVEDFKERLESKKIDNDIWIGWTTTSVILTGASVGTAFIPFAGWPITVALNLIPVFGRLIHIKVAQYQRSRRSAISMNTRYLTLLLVGKTGSGISSTANTILGQHTFETSDNSNTETSQVQVKTVIEDGFSLTVVDTPGLMYTGLDSDETKLKACNGLQEAVSKCPDKGQTVVIIVLKYGDRFSEENRTVLHILKQMFGEGNFGQSFVLVVTYGDVYDLKYPNGQMFDSWIKGQTNDVGDLLSLVQYRCVKVNNKCKDAGKKRAQRKSLFDLVTSLEHGYSREQFSQLHKQHHRLRLEAKLSKKQAFYRLKELKWSKKFYLTSLTSKDSNSYDLLSRKISKHLEEMDGMDGGERIFYNEEESRFFAGFRKRLELLERNVKTEQAIVKHENLIDQLTEDLDTIGSNWGIDEINHHEEKLKIVKEKFASDKDFCLRFKLHKAESRLKESKRNKISEEFRAKINKLRTDWESVKRHITSVSSFVRLIDSLDEVNLELTKHSRHLKGLEDLLNEVEDLSFQMHSFEKDLMKFSYKINNSNMWLIIAVIIACLSIITGLIIASSVFAVVAVLLTIMVLLFLVFGRWLPTIFVTAQMRDQESFTLQGIESKESM
ncbi:uncharacterized protein LOC106072015 isoform X1 [Biomphalaria glabrata]|uniref:Uncharacterized protein LOC106072015 isoform X1 n=2 Tax=Biomphalaria glabrata TaxID=6526 RepID=A0A9W3BFE1_BIOGL|nr:uncharacterized protein LOC106072015 isoform X1 [Biomphalaria glabrata]